MKAPSDLMSGSMIGLLEAVADYDGSDGAMGYTVYYYLTNMEAGTLERIPQDHENMTYDPMLTKEMGVIDWTGKATDIVNRIHGLNPWPGCSTAIEGGRLKLLRAEVAEGAGQPGEIIVADPKQGLVIAAGERAVSVTQLQAPGGKPMNSKDYLRGHPMAVGTVLKEEISNG